MRAVVGDAIQAYKAASAAKRALSSGENDT
jgi:hypothetical protein